MGIHSICRTRGNRPHDHLHQAECTAGPQLFRSSTHLECREHAHHEHALPTSCCVTCRRAALENMAGSIGRGRLAGKGRPSLSWTVARLRVLVCACCVAACWSEPIPHLRYDTSNTRERCSCIPAHAPSATASDTECGARATSPQA